MSCSRHLDGFYSPLGVDVSLIKVKKQNHWVQIVTSVLIQQGCGHQQRLVACIPPPLPDSPLSSWLRLKRDTLFIPFFSAVISTFSKEAVKDMKT